MGAFGHCILLHMQYVATLAIAAPAIIPTVTEADFISEKVLGHEVARFS